MAHILPGSGTEPFLPPRRGAFAESGTDPNGVPWCPVDMPVGWNCPSCGHSYAPWVPECHHCPQPSAFTVKGSDPGPIEAGR